MSTKCILLALAVLAMVCSAKAAGECLTHEFVCKNGPCVSFEYVCDGLNHCTDGSDEQFCFNHTYSSHEKDDTSSTTTTTTTTSNDEKPSDEKPSSEKPSSEKPSSEKPSGGKGQEEGAFPSILPFPRPVANGFRQAVPRFTSLFTQLLPPNPPSEN